LKLEPGVGGSVDLFDWVHNFLGLVNTYCGAVGSGVQSVLGFEVGFGCWLALDSYEGSQGWSAFYNFQEC
jgi:hypothetical protein